MSDWPVTMRPGNSPDYRAILTTLYQLAGRGAAVDLGCGEAHVTKDWQMCTLVDLVIRPATGRGIEQMDIRNAPKFFSTERRRFNLCVMTDVIEHLVKSEAEQLLFDMDALCGAMVVFTPVGPWRMNPLATEPDTHKSGWTPAEFAAKGWVVWEWTRYHQFKGGEELGAFWAWKFRGDSSATPTVAVVAERSGVQV